MNILSLFANIGVAEARMKNTQHKVVLANELEPKRVEIYKAIYPDHEIIQGDILKQETQELIIEKAKELEVDCIMATPPCQGMSALGKGYRNKVFERKQLAKMEDPRNQLTIPTVKLIKELKPKYVFIENVIQYLKTGIMVNNVIYTIEDYLQEQLGEDYIIKGYKINTMNFGVPQSRRRQIMLMTRKDMEAEWELPEEDAEVVTLEKAIGHLPSLDPEIKDEPYEKMLELFPDFEEKKRKGMEFHPWHYPCKMPRRHVEAIMHTPTGHGAFENEYYYPKKINGERVSGFSSTYARQSWDKPASTVTMGNGNIGNQSNGHPGRYIKDEEKDGIKAPVYSDARVLTPYEILIVSSLPEDWVDFETFPYSGETIRKYIGEGIPPLFVEKVFNNIDA